MNEISDSLACKKPKRDRGEVLRAIRDQKLEKAFAGKVFDVVREVHLPPGHVFQTQFGNRGRHGYVIRDRETGEDHVVGRQVLEYIHDRYLGVTLPPKKRRRRVVPSE